jgi:CheY-like chemotaxis protein
MDKGTILFIDDELCPNSKGPSGNYMWYYVEALRDASYTVVEVPGPDDALTNLKAKDQHYDLIILDIMMPPGAAYRTRDTSNGLRTGILVVQTLHEQWPDIPVLVLTNVLNQEALNSLNRFPNVKSILGKPRYTPFLVCQEVRKI